MVSGKGGLYAAPVLPHFAARGQQAPEGFARAARAGKGVGATPAEEADEIQAN